MSGFYDQMRGIADSLLGPQSQFAQGSIVLRRHIPGGGPDWDPDPPTVVDYPVSGAVRGVGQDHIDGTVIVVGDLIATITVPPVEPLTSDKLVIDGRERQIVKIERKPAAGTAVAFLVFVRG
jgi:hypothetical protein